MTLSTVLVELLWKHLLSSVLNRKGQDGHFGGQFTSFLPSEFKSVLGRGISGSICVQGGRQDHRGDSKSRGVLTDSLAFPRVRTKIEKEKKEHAKLHGMIRTEISGAEIAEEMEKERRYFQLQMCEVGVRGGRAGPPRGLGASAEVLWMLLATFCPSGSLRLLECGIRLI